MKKFTVILLMIAVLLTAVPLAFSRGQAEAEEEVLVFEDKAPEEYEGTIVDWRHSGQALWFIENFEEVYPNVEVKHEIVATTSPEYTQQTLSAAASGVGAPDIFTAWSMTIERVKESGYWENLSAPPYNAEELVDDLVPYTVEVGRDKDGNIRGLSYQATIGGMYYRRSLAKEYFGTDDPEEIGKIFSTIDGMIEAGKIIKEKSNGEVSLISRFDDLRPMILANREEGWINENNELVIDPKVYEYYDIAKEIRDLDLSAEAEFPSPPFFATMQNKTVFSYFLPTWGLNFVIQPNAPETAGDWAVTNAPFPFFRGGIWMGIYSGSENKELAWEYMKYTLFDEENAFKIGTERGLFVSLMPVQQRIAEEVRSGKAVEFMGGQQPYKYWRQHTEDINYKILTRYDNIFEDFLDNSVESYISGRRTKEQAIENLKADVKNAFPEIIVN